jgi:hypothetical protein
VAAIYTLRQKAEAKEKNWVLATVSAGGLEVSEPVPMEDAELVLRLMLELSDRRREREAAAEKTTYGGSV